MGDKSDKVDRHLTKIDEQVALITEQLAELELAMTECQEKLARLLSPPTTPPPSEV